MKLNAFCMLLTLSGLLKSRLSLVKVDFGRILTSHSISCRCFTINMPDFCFSTMLKKYSRFKDFKNPVDKQA